jgi:hypothetical protein
MEDGTCAEGDDPDVDEAAVGDARVGRLPPVHGAPGAPFHRVRPPPAGGMLLDLLQQRRRRLPLVLHCCLLEISLLSSPSF